MEDRKSIPVIPLLIVAALAGVIIFRIIPKDLGDAPAWQLVDGLGRTHTDLDYQGELVLLDFWATWCGPCRIAMPEIQHLHETYAKRGLNVFGANISENSDPIRFMQEGGFTYQTLLNADPLAREMNVEGIPTIVLVGPEGDVLYRSVGVPSEGEVAKLVSVIERELEALGR